MDEEKKTEAKTDPFPDAFDGLNFRVDFGSTAGWTAQVVREPYGAPWEYGETAEAAMCALLATVRKAKLEAMKQSALFLGQRIAAAESNPKP